MLYLRRGKISIGVQDRYWSLGFRLTVTKRWRAVHFLRETALDDSGRQVMAAWMGRSCGYGFLMHAFPASSFNTKPAHSAASWSRLASYFFLRSSSSSCRSRRLKLSGGPSLSCSRSPALFSEKVELVNSPSSSLKLPSDTGKSSASSRKNKTSILNSREDDARFAVTERGAQDAKDSAVQGGTVIAKAGESLEVSAKKSRKRKLSSSAAPEAISRQVEVDVSANSERQNRLIGSEQDSKTLIDGADIYINKTRQKLSRTGKPKTSTSKKETSISNSSDTGVVALVATRRNDKVQKSALESGIVTDKVEESQVASGKKPKEKSLPSAEIDRRKTKKVNQTNAETRKVNQANLDASMSSESKNKDMRALSENVGVIANKLEGLQETSAEKLRKEKLKELASPLVSSMSRSMVVEDRQDAEAVKLVASSPDPEDNRATAHPRAKRKRKRLKGQSTTPSLTNTVASAEVIFSESYQESAISDCISVEEHAKQIRIRSNVARSLENSCRSTVSTQNRGGAESESSANADLMQDTKQNYMDPMSTFWDRSLPLGAEVSAPPLQDSANEWIDSGNTDIPGNIEQEASLLKAKGERFEFQKQKTDNSSVAKRHPLQGTVSVRTEAQKQKMDSSFGGQSYVMQERASIRTEGSIRSKELPSQSYDRQGTERKNTSYDSPKYLLQRSEQTTKHQVSSHQDTESQQGYGLANMDRASGLDRKKRKEFTLRTVVANQASTLSYIQIFGTGFDTGDTMPTLLLFFDRRRFLFNVGEGFHRFSNEHKFKLSKVDHVFLTRVCTETIGGLPGLILSLAEINETVKTWGPSSLNDFAKAARIFVPSGWLEHTHSFGPGINDDACLLSPSSPPIFLMEDELIKISAVLLSSEHAALNKANYASSTDERKGNMLSAVYICELSTVRGKFDPVKARSKGLSPGRKYGLLQRGESVLSDDGTKMVHPEDVLGPSSPGPIVLVVDCPSASYISSLINSASLQSFFPGSGKVVNCMIHIGPPSVTSLEAYQSWMENFKVTDHIMARREMSVLGEPTLTSSVKLRSRLNMVCPWFFPSVEVNDETQKPAVNSRMAIGKNLLKYRLRPLADLGLDTSEVLEGFDSAAFQKEMATDVMKAQEMAQEIWKRWSEGKFISSLLDRGTRGEKCLPACLHDVSREEMEVVFLGTGSSQPSKHRNVTGIYIHLFERGGLLLDCGEGTFAQLKRRYGAEGADNVLMGLKCIWISHMHADHFLGLGRILSARKELLERCSIYDPLLVVGPKLLKSFLDSYGKIEDLMMEFLDCSQTTLEAKKCADNGNVRGGEYRRGSLIHGSLRTGERNRMQHIWNLPGYHISRGIDMEGRRRLRSVLSLLGLKDLISVPVIHCLHAFGVVLEAEDRRITENARKPGWKLVFSGDTRPCQALVDAAQGATILIHEATFDDALIADAVKKNHSITKEAIQVGVHAGVYRIFLTHFSQRYPKIPAFDNRFHDRTCFAFDMMSVNLADLPVVPEFVPALQTLFQDQSDTEEDAEETTAVCP